MHRFQSDYANEILIILSFGCWTPPAIAFRFFLFFFFSLSFSSSFFQLLVIAARYHSGASIAAPNPSPKVCTRTHTRQTFQCTWVSWENKKPFGIERARKSIRTVYLQQHRRASFFCVCVPFLCLPLNTYTTSIFHIPYFSREAKQHTGQKRRRVMSCSWERERERVQTGAATGAQVIRHGALVNCSCWCLLCRLRALSRAKKGGNK